MRIAREWRLDETGDVGSVTILYDNTLLPAGPAGYNQYLLFLDADGDFNTGVIQVPLVKSAEGYTATGVDISDGLDR